MKIQKMMGVRTEDTLQTPGTYLFIILARQASNGGLALPHPFTTRTKCQKHPSNKGQALKYTYQRRQEIEVNTLSHHGT